MKKVTKTWITKDGYEIRICDMSDTHLENTIRLLQKKNLMQHPSYQHLTNERSRRQVHGVSVTTEFNKKKKYKKPQRDEYRSQAVRDFLGPTLSDYLDATIGDKWAERSGYQRDPITGQYWTEDEMDQY